MVIVSRLASYHIKIRKGNRKIPSHNPVPTPPISPGPSTSSPLHFSGESMPYRSLQSAVAAFAAIALVSGCSDKEPAAPLPPPPPPPVPTQLAFTVQPGQALADSILAPAVTVEVRSATGSPIPGATNMVTLTLHTNPTGASLMGTTSVAAVNGVATFADLQLAERGRGYTMTATSESLQPDTSSAFNIVLPMNADGVAPGREHSCAEVGYGVYCWGRNTNGELGDGTLVASHLAVEVPFEWPGGAAVSHVAVGDDHTCATTSVAELYCWGSDSSGQLGIGSQGGRRTSPVLVGNGMLFVGVSAGRAHTCAITVPAPETHIYCWGANEHGQLGDGTNEPRSVPVLVAGGMAFSSVTARMDHTCGVATTGVPYCWGDNALGQLGDGSTTQRNSPEAVEGGHAFLAVSTGSNHTCGVTAGAKAYCWGENSHGELGDGTTTGRTVPVMVAAEVGFAGITAGTEFSCALGTNQALYCWGRNLEGQLGIGTFTDQPTPQPVSGNLNPTGITAGYQYACATTFDLHAYCWGSNTSGKLGDGTTTTRVRPVLVVY
jgi:alpha-tubulin suppressor-like RCC1 family protein